MRTNFNFKAEWMLAIDSLDADCKLIVFQIISIMGLHDVDIDEAFDIAGLATDDIEDVDALKLLNDVEKVMRRRRRARQRAAMKRLAAKNAKADDEKITGNNNNSGTTVQTSDGMTTPPATAPKRRRNKHRHQRKWRH